MSMHQFYIVKFVIKFVVCDKNDFIIFKLEKKT